MLGSKEGVFMEPKAFVLLPQGDQEVPDGILGAASPEGDAR